MSEAQILELPQWDLAAEQLPERSRLYAPAPVGMGTAMGESLTSYLARLAVAHCVYPGVLLREMIVPLLEEAETQENVSGHKRMCLNSIPCGDATEAARI